MLNPRLSAAGVGETTKPARRRLLPVATSRQELLMLPLPGEAGETDGLCLGVRGADLSVAGLRLFSAL